MKKFRLLFTGLAILSISFLSFSQADTILDYIKHMDDASKSASTFGYLETDNISIKYVSNNYIEIASPIVKNGTKDITSYIFYASTNKVYGDAMTYRCYDDISSYITTNGNKFTLELDTKGLNSSEIYYLYAIPVDLTITGVYNGSCSASEVETLVSPSIGTYGDSSFINGKDPCFRIDEGVYGEGNDCKKNNGTSGNNNNEHSSNNSNNSRPYTITSNTTHACNNKQITIGRNSFDDVSIEVLLWYEDENTFKKIGDVRSDKLSYTFSQVFDGDHIVKLKPTDGTTPVDYTIHCLDSVSPQVTPTNTVKPPVVGPKENIMIIIIGTVVLYLLYRITTRKRS